MAYQEALAATRALFFVWTGEKRSSRALESIRRAPLERSGMVSEKQRTPSCVARRIRTCAASKATRGEATRSRELRRSPPAALATGGGITQASEMQASLLPKEGRYAARRDATARRKRSASLNSSCAFPTTSCLSSFCGARAANPCKPEGRPFCTHVFHDILQG